MKARALILAALLGLTTGCNKQLKDFVEATPRSLAPDPTPDLGVTGAVGVKFSGGQVRATTTGGLGMQVTVSPTSNKVLGTSVGARVGVSRSRTSQ